MAQVKLLKIGLDGVPTEFASATDEITLASYTVQGGGPVLGATGLDLNNQDVSDVNDLAFNNPATGTINQTAGALIVDNIMAKDRENLLTTAGSVTFPVITDVAGQVDAFRLPALAGAPSATPATGGAGQVVYDSTAGDPYIWNGSTWDNLNLVKSAESVDNGYIAEVTVAARDLVYISSADNVSPAVASSVALARAVGFAITGAAAAAPVIVRADGLLSGFTGLTAGAAQYLSPSVAGTLTETLPVGAGNVIIQAGYAKSATVLQIQLQRLGVRAA